MKISIADIPGLRRHNLFVKMIRVFSVPIMNALPSSLIRRMMKKTSRDAGKVTETGGTTHALEVMYTRHNRKLFSRGLFQGIADYFWHHVISQPEALRNRLKIIGEIIKSCLIELANKRVASFDKNPVRILSIAGGSARSIIKTIVDLQEKNLSYRIEVTVLDKDKSALKVGEKNSQEAGVSENFQWIHGQARDVKTLLPDKTFDIIEIVGLLDYFPDERAIHLLKVTGEVMKNDGVIVIANVMPNPEVSFVHKTGWPQMIYRKPDDLRNLLNSAGFTKETNLITEPLGVHCVALACK